MTNAEETYTNLNKYLLLSVPIRDYLKMVKGGNFVFTIPIQRNDVWDVKRKSLLIDSLLKNYPINPFYVVKNGNVCNCIDGKQRSLTIKSFVDDEFALTGLSDAELEGKKFSELDEDQQYEIMGYTLTVNRFDGIDDEEVREIMSRMNNGKALSGVELSRIKAKTLSVISGLGEHRLFMENLSQNALCHFINEEMVIKTAIMDSGNYDLSLKNVKKYYEDFDFGEIKDELSETFDATAKALDVTKSVAPKKVYGKIIKKINLLTVINFVAETENAGERTEEIGNFLAEFFDDLPSDYAEASKMHSTNEDNVLTRRDCIRLAFDTCIK